MFPLNIIDICKHHFLILPTSYPVKRKGQLVYVQQIQKINLSTIEQRSHGKERRQILIEYLREKKISYNKDI